jgi:flavin reductase (DIM6/NTAB) family NADH-FMN oxidoreductase RutF
MLTDADGFVEVPKARWDRITGNYNPVVIITTKDRQGRSNAAPIAMCMEVSHNPVLLAFSVGKDKDTCRNVEETGEFVINVPGENVLKEMMVTAIRYRPGVNELAEAGFQELPGLKVGASRIKECKIHLECCVEWIKDAAGHAIVLGRVVSATIDKRSVTDDFKLKIETIKPVHYLGKGTDIFMGVSDFISMPRRSYRA